MLTDIVREGLKETNLAMVGGETNNAHLLEIFHHWARHRLRTFDGEVSHQIERPGHFECFMWRQILNGNSQKPGIIEDFLVQTTIDPMPIPYSIYKGEFWLSNKTLLEAEKEIFRANDLHVQTVYNAIKPEHFAGQEFRRAIHWDAVTKWIQTFTENHEIDVGEFYENFVVKDDYNIDHLTEDGVKLLLWDLGVFTPSTT
jgi:hypothetical protein